MPSAIVVATLQAATLNCISNVIAQAISTRRAKVPFALDVLQLVRFIALALFTTPPNYHWQAFLERTFPAYEQESSPGGGEKSPRLPEVGGRRGPGAERPRLNLKNTFTKWFVDCITIGNLVNTTLFLVLMGLMKGQTAGQILRSWRLELFPIIFASYRLWPLASIISFSFIPVERRIVFLSFIGLIWGIYMSLVAARV